MDQFQAHDGELNEITKHLHDALNHGETVDLTFDSGDFVEVDPHTIAIILRDKMVDEMVMSSHSPETFQLFLTKLFGTV